MFSLRAPLDAQRFYAGTFYKFGHNGFLYYWCEARKEWFKSAANERHVSASYVCQDGRILDTQE